jgi:Nickel-dependent hydrogenase
LPRLFSLCSVAHQVAFLSAVEAARGEDVGTVARQLRKSSVIAERLTELLRGLFVGHVAPDSDSAAAVRAAMQAVSILGAGIGAGSSSLPGREAVSRLETALTTLGISSEEATPLPSSFLARQIAAFEKDTLVTIPAKPSFLSVDDDRGVIARLFAEGRAFSDAPELDGRVPETGVWARGAMRNPLLLRNAGPADRLKARITEVTELCVWLVSRAQGGGCSAVGDDLVASYHLGSARGAAAVECARGRLHHAVELDGEGRIARFEFVAPTEWNFHARGPLVRCLQDAILTGRRKGLDAVRALVGSFDPCVGFNLSFREAAHA